jgi:hypothetical protein
MIVSMSQKSYSDGHLNSTSSVRTEFLAGTSGRLTAYFRFHSGLELSRARGVAQGDAGPGIGGDGLEAPEYAVAMGRVGWHRYATGVQAAEESRNEVEARRIDQQHALAGKAHVPQASPNGSSSPIELGVGQTGVIALAAEQMDEGRLPRAFVGVATQHADQVAGKLM